MSTPSSRTRAMLTALVGSVFILAACGSPQDPSPTRAPAAAPVAVQLFASSATASVGSRISVSLGGTMADGAPLAGVEGWLRFAPAALRYVGTAEHPVSTIAANDSGAARGRVRVVAVRPGSLDPDAPVLAFDVLKTDYLGTLTFETGAAVGPTGKLQRGGGTRRAAVRSTLSATIAVRAANAQKNAMKNLVVPTIYGDADASGAVAQADADLVGAWVVGNGAPPDTGTFNIANVAPQNLPGIGGPSDTFPPGWGPPFVWGGFVRRTALTDPPISLVCERMLDLDDLLLISQEAGGTNVEVPGEVMPAGSQRPGCADPAADTTRPVVPDQDPQITTDLVIPAPDGAGSYHRNVLYVTFHDSTSGSTVQSVLQRYSATIVGGIVRPADEDDYIVQVPDPGPTWTALQQLIQQIGSEPGVLRVGAAPAKTFLKIRGRYPEDGAFSTRADWFRSPATVGTQPRLAIRAPLAWGCENGLYGSNRPRIAVADLLFDWQHEDFEGSTVQFDPLPTGTARIVSPALTDAINGPHNRAHGTGVAGVLAATGDNGRGIAGMVWGSDLYLYAMAEGQDEARDLDLRLARILQSVNAAGVRIFATSLAFGRSADTALVARVRSALRPYLLSGGIVVVPTGNEAVFRTIADVAISTDTLVTATDRALAQLYPAFSAQIMFVAGTDRNQAFWAAGAGKTSNLWLGATAVAAPAELVLTLGIRSEPDAQLAGAPFGTRLFSGTSFAAPHVAGVAALLRAMEPSLTAAEVKAYLLRGAQEPKQDPLTGAVPAAGDSVARRVPGAPGPLYQLDAYGSLTLLSRERQSTPLCGIEVVHREHPVTRIWSVTANRQSPELLIANASGGFDVLSVAQGGRRLAVAATPYVLAGSTWQSLSPVASVEQVVYAERDTVSLRYETADNLHFDLGARVNNNAWQTLTQGLRHGIRSNGGFITTANVSPAGEHVVLNWRWADGFLDISCGPYGVGEGVYLVRLSNLQITPFSEYNGTESCSGSSGTGVQEEFMTVAWKRDGSELLRAVTLTAPSYALHSYLVGAQGLQSNGIGPTVSGYVATDMDWSPEGGRVTVRESSLGFPSAIPCQLVIRRVTMPYTSIDALPINEEVCQWRPRVAPLRDGLLTALRSTAPRPAGRYAPWHLKHGAYADQRHAHYSVRAN